MAYGLSAVGFTAKPLEVCLAEIRDRLRLVFGAGVDLDERQPLGQLAGIVAEREAELWELIEDVYRAMDPAGNVGDAQDAICAITGTIREPPRKSSVTAQLGGTAGTIVPAGAVAKVSGTGVRFALRAPVAVPGTGVFDAVDTGPLPAQAGTLTVIETPVGGWSTVTNLLDATLGANIESHGTLRVRREQELRAGGAAALDAIRAKVLAVPGVLACTVFENTGSTTSGDGIPAKAFEVLAQGGSAYDIALAIWRAKAAGIEAHGTTSVQVADSQGVNRTVKFTRPAIKSIYAAVTLTKDAARFPADGADQVKAAIVAAAAKLSVGDDVITRALIPSVLSVSGVLDVPSLFVGLAANPTSEANLVIAARELAAFDTSRIAVDGSGGAGPPPTIARWDFSETGLPATVADAIGSYPLSVTYGSNGGFAASFVAGWQGNALDFNGSNTYLGGTFSAQALWAEIVNGDFTLEAFLKDISLAPAGWYPIVCIDQPPKAGMYQRFGVRVVSPTDIRLWVNRTIPAAGNGYRETGALAALASVTGWHSIAVVKTAPSAQNYEFFVDGVSVATILGVELNQPPASGNVYISIGAGQDTTALMAEFWPRQIDTVRISRVALAAASLLR